MTTRKALAHVILSPAYLVILVLLIITSPIIAVMWASGEVMDD